MNVNKGEILNNILFSEYYSLDRMRDFLPTYKPQRNRPDLMPPKAQGRNEPCLCGSGNKYKKCCGSRESEEVR